MPSLVILLEVDVFTLKRRLLFAELGACWLRELFDVAVEVEDFGWVVVVNSDPMEALPLSELALQLPLEECGGSSLLPPDLRWRRCAELSRNFTAMFMTEERGLEMGRLTLDLSDDEIEGLRSCDRRSLSTFRLRFIVTVS